MSRPEPVRSGIAPADRGEDTGGPGTEVDPGADSGCIVITDVAYAAATSTESAVAAAVVASGWTCAQPQLELVTEPTPARGYVPGALYERELPALLDVLAQVSARAPGRIHTVVVDGYVWLEAGARRPGLGAHLHAAMGTEVAVVGIAKRHFRGSDAIPVHRGGSTRPLFVSSAGMDVAVAARAVADMHGPHRIPTLCRAADALCREGLRHRLGSEAERWTRRQR